MKYQSKWNLKWFEAAKNHDRTLSFSLIRQCVFSVHSASQDCLGFTVFEPRDLNPQFLDKLHQRMAQFENQTVKFELILPDFLKARAETILAPTMNSRLKIVYSSYVKIQSQGSYFGVSHRLRVVNVDDSPVILKLLKHIFSDFGFVDVIGQFSESKDAAQRILELKPDFVTMDIQMPEKTGVEVVKEILGEVFYPIIMISSLSIDEGSLVIDALNAGAFDYVQKPRLEDRTQFQNDLLEKLLLAVGRRENRPTALRSRAAKPKAASTLSGLTGTKNLIWALGSSTGGIQALTEVFTSLPNGIPPTLVVQHMPPVFSKSFAESLGRLCPFSIKEAEDGDELKDNHVYIAPGGLQMKVEAKFGKKVIRIVDDPPVNRFKPSVDYFFNSLCVLEGISVVAGILTGMGRDGAAGLLELRKRGARTLAQNEESCAVFGMPRAAIELNAVERVISLDAMAEHFLTMSRSERKTA
jgi:two-component system chemotaxis response regulator CheB